MEDEYPIIFPCDGRAFSALEWEGIRDGPISICRSLENSSQ